MAFRTNRWPSRMWQDHLNDDSRSLFSFEFCSYQTDHYSQRCKVSSGIRQENQQDSNRSTLFVIDGIENMPWLHRKVFLKFIQTSAGGLLLTTHRAFKGIPVIYQITPSFIIFSNIVSHISPDHVIDEQRLKSIFIQNNYSIRESLMSLYTIWEEDRQRFIPVRDTQSA